MTLSMYSAQRRRAQGQATILQYYSLLQLHRYRRRANTGGAARLKYSSDHIQVNRAPYMRRRTYRAHGRINPYMSSPCHVEMILSEKEQVVPRAEEEVEVKKVSKKKLAREKLKARE